MRTVGWDKRSAVPPKADGTYAGCVIERKQDMVLVELADGSRVHVPVGNVAVDLDARQAGTGH